MSLVHLRVVRIANHCWQVMWVNDSQRSLGNSQVPIFTTGIVASRGMIDTVRSYLTVYRSAIEVGILLQNHFRDIFRCKNPVRIFARRDHRFGVPTVTCRTDADREASPDSEPTVFDGTRREAIKLRRHVRSDLVVVAVSRPARSIDALDTARAVATAQVGDSSIAAVETDKIRVWQSTRGNYERIVIATEGFSYVVILDDRGDYVL